MYYSKNSKPIPITANQRTLINTFWSKAITQTSLQYLDSLFRFLKFSFKWLKFTVVNSLMPYKTNFNHQQPMNSFQKKKKVLLSLVLLFLFFLIKP